MKYLIKSQRDGWYFTHFEKASGEAEFGKIQEAKIYQTKSDALKDLCRMGKYCPRIIAITRMGRSNSEKERSPARSV